MDNSWLFENEEEKEEEEPSSDEESKQTELEERLYAVVHHNDLSQPLPSELAKYYTIQCADNGELEVTLNNSLDVVKSAENEKISNLLKTSESIVDESDKTNTAVAIVDDDIVIVDEIKPTNDPKPVDNKYSRKRFRYSDVTLDEFQVQQVTLNEFPGQPITLDEFQRQEVNVESSTNDIYYFDYDLGLFQNKKNRKFKNLKVPPRPSISDWKNDSNVSFISVGPHMSKEKDVLNYMTNALADLNPNEDVNKLLAFARVLYRRNLMLSKRKKKRALKKARKLNRLAMGDSSCNSSFNVSNEIQDLKYKIQEYNSEHSTSYSETVKTTHFETLTRKQKREDIFRGSISLNISPFKPDPSTPLVVDLCSDNEQTARHFGKSITDSYNVWEECSSQPTPRAKYSSFPSKWTKNMIKFYTKGCNTELSKDIGAIIANLKRKSGGKEWYLDPMDKKGHYQHGYKKGRRCANCNERGHVVQDCCRPIKLPACTLCGELYHTDYSCPNKVCLKCGKFIMGDVFGGECNDCYYMQFNSEEPCSICREVTHKASNCTDLWRSFHATTGGEKKIPDDVMVNKRKSCCNCGRKGHFSHGCPFITYSGQQISAFVKNYSAEPLEKGSVDIIISKNYADFIYSEEGDQFFHYLSDSTQAVIGVNGEGCEIVCKINGTFEQCKKAKYEIENFVNTRKRKRQEPQSKRKRQRVRF